MKLRFAGGKNPEAPVLHIRMQPGIGIAEGPMASRAGQSVLVQIVGIQVDEAFLVRDHFVVARECQVGGIARLHRLFISLAHAFHRARPACAPMILIIELNAEATGVVALVFMHK